MARNGIGRVPSEQARRRTACRSRPTNASGFSAGAIDRGGGIKAGADDDAFGPPHAGSGLDPPGLSQARSRARKTCAASLGALDEVPDLVNLFRASEHVPHHVDEILALPRRPAGVWLQLGIRHPASARRLEEAGISVVEDRCLMVEHARLLGSRG
jgi:hypothetical protein